VPGGAAPSFEKTSEQLEATYRRLGDSRRANAIRMCRTQGGGVCNAVLTQSEVQALYALAQSSGGNRSQIRAGIGNAAPTLALLMGPGTATGLAGGIGTAAGTGTVVGTGAVAGTEAVVGTGAVAATGAAAGIGGGAIAATGVGAIVLVCAIAGYQLWQMTRFQTALEQAGYIILDDPLQICIRGCHQGTTPRRVPDFGEIHPFPPLRPGDLERWLPPRPGPRPRPVPDPETQPQPQPRPVRRPLPDPDVDEEERRGCRGFATFQRGGNSCHDRFATAISGVPREWMVVTPEGISDSFDARGQDRSTLWEMKTGYGWVNRPDLTSAQQRWRQTTIERWTTQAAHQQVVADRCGYHLRWAFTSEEARRFADPLVQANTVTFRFSCSEDGERGL
jgi:hypothetical protein